MSKSGGGAILFQSSLGISDGKMWASGVRLSLGRLLDDADFFVGQAVGLVDKLVDCWGGNEHDLSSE